MTERIGAVKLEGTDVTLLGEEIRPGMRAPGFTVLDNGLKEVSFPDAKKGIRIICSVPSLDTPICTLEIKRFNDEAASLSKDVSVIFVSMDLPFAQKRFVKENGIKKVKTYSDHRDADFGQKYGVLIKGMRLLARAVFIVDASGAVRYAQYVDDIAHAPDYDAALAALKEISGSK